MNKINLAPDLPSGLRFEMVLSEAFLLSASPILFHGFVGFCTATEELQHRVLVVLLCTVGNWVGKLYFVAPFL